VRARSSPDVDGAGCLLADSRPHQVFVHVETGRGTLQAVTQGFLNLRTTLLNAGAVSKPDAAQVPLLRP
jgi:hypothetical protein